MRFRYDPISGALYFRIREGEIEETLELPSPGAYVDVDVDGHVMGLEFLSLQEFVGYILGEGGEVVIPEQLDPKAFTEQLRRANAEVMRDAYERTMEHYQRNMEEQDRAP